MNIGGFFEALNFRAGYSDYEHTEFEGDEVGTVFSVSGIEARAELVQADHDGWRGVIGTQVLARDFNAIGAEAFVPKNSLESWAFFTVQEADLGDLELEGALRFDQTTVTANSINFDRSFNTVSGAVGLAYAPDDAAFKIGANISRSERAPSAEELLSDGPHIATQAYEIGNPDFTTEKSWGGELYARWDSDNVQLSATVYTNFFKDYIFEAETAAEEDGLPVFQYFQRDATYYGFEASASTVIAHVGGFDLIADGVATMSAPRSIMAVVRYRASRPCVCSAGSRRIATISTCAPKSNGPTARKKSPLSRRRPTALPWLTPRRPGGRSARMAA
ncbi:TonB-dependent receptor plug domain-containing protein [Sphingopyxis sp. BSNA05]|uniref:TonB-dependent receptor plug domain-containing protein n=1 Tax=Sphingopyxis sp. BSNA05 TaxID=1236614 RepID=UPI00349F8F70